MSYQFGRPSRFAELSDPTGPVAQREWQEFLHRREDLLEQIMGRIDARQQMIQDSPVYPSPDDPSTPLNPADQIDTQINTAALSDQYRGQFGTSEYNDLLGQADFYGISNAQSVPPQELASLIERRRSGVLNERINAGEFERGIGERAVDALQTSIGTIFTGSTQALIDLSQRIPFLGDVLAKTETIRQADQWLSKVSEGYHGGLTDDEEAGWRIAHGLGGMLGYALPAAATYNFMRTLPAVARLSPIIRGAIAGGTSAWLLEGGGDAPLSQRGMNIALGAGLGGAGEAGGALAGAALGGGIGAAGGYLATEDAQGAVMGGVAGGLAGAVAGSVLPRLMGRAQRSFFSETGGSPRQAPVVDGEWRFEEDLMLESGPKLLTAGSRGGPAEMGPRASVRMDQVVPEPSSIPREPLGEPFGPASGSSPMERGLQLSRGQRLPELGTAQRNELDQLRSQINEVLEQRNVARRQAEMHPLTGLPNRRAFDLARASADADPDVGYVVMDARGFKKINDQLGHTRGDEALQNFAIALNRAAQDTGIPARLFHFGGDEFAAIVPKGMLDDFATAARKLSRQRFRRPLEQQESASIYHVAEHEPGVDEYAIAIPEGIDSTIRGILYSDEALSPTTRAGALELEIPDIGDLGSSMVTKYGEAITEQFAQRGKSVNSFFGYRETGSGPGRIAEIPTSSFGRLTTELDAFTGSTFDEADQGLMSFKSRNRAAGEMLNVRSAQGEAIALSKQASIMESPALAEMAAQPSFDDYDVARALVASNPGQASVVKGVTPQILERISPDTPLSEANFRFVPRRSEYDPSITDIETGRPQGWVPETDELAPIVEQMKANIYRRAMMGDPEAVESRRFLEESKAQRKRELVGYIPYPDRVDALINATDKQVAQYSRYGMFEDQKVVTANGKEAVIVGFSGDNVVLRTTANKNLRFKAKMANVMPSKSGGMIADAPDEYAAFAQEAQNKLSGEAGQAGIGPFDWLSHEMSSQLPRYMNEYFDGQGFDPATRGMLEEYFNYQRVQDFKQLAPEDFALADRLMREAADLMNMRAESQHDLPVTVEDLAAAKGFELSVNDEIQTVILDILGNQPETYMTGWGNMTRVDFTIPTRRLDVSESLNQETYRASGLYDPETGMFRISLPAMEGERGALGLAGVRKYGATLAREMERVGMPISYFTGIRTTGAGANRSVSIPIESVTKSFGVLRDKMSSLQVPVEDEDAAKAFLQNFDREMPDHTPISTVPAELFDVVPGGSSPMEGPEPTWADFENRAEWTEKAADAMERDLSYINLNNARRLTGGGGGGTGLPPTGSFAQLPPPPPPPSPGQQFARADPRRTFELEKRMDSLWLRIMEPFTNWTLTAQRYMEEAGISNELWRQKADVVNGVSRAHNEMQPWIEQAADIFNRFRHKYLRDGTVVKIEQFPNWNDKLAAMRKAGYTGEEIEAQQMIRPLMDGGWGVARESAPIGYVFDYLPAMRNLQSRGVKDPFGEWEKNHLPFEWKWFARYARSANTQARHLDIRDLVNTYFRGLFFEKHVAPSWNAMKQDWAHPSIPDYIAVPVNGWLDIVRAGPGAQKDVMVSGFRHVLNKFGVPATDADVRGMYGGVLGTMYRAGLGLQPHIIFRDAIQPFFWATEQRDGFKYLAQSYRDLMNPAKREAMWERALQGGWVQKGQAQVATSEVFSRQPMTAEGDNLLSDPMEARRESMAQVFDRLYDITPRGLKQGIQGTWFDPMKLYTREGELNRLVTGEAGYQKALAALNEGGLDTQILRNAGLHVYDEPIVQHARALLRAGNQEEFLNLAANEAANSQFRYGSIEAPVGIQQLGTTGRAIMMYGTFTTQYMARMRQNLANFGREGTRADAAGFLARQTAVWAAITAAGAATGWKALERWKWHRSLTFAGGPPAIAATQAVMAGTGVVAGAFAQRPSPEQQSAMAQFGMRGANAFFPYAGGMRTLQGMTGAAEGIAPVEELSRGLVTGEWGSGRTFKSLFDDPSFIERWQYGTTPPSYQDINSVMGDRSRVQGITGSGTVFDTRPRYSDSLPPIPSSPTTGGGGASF